jgi:chemotaxis protein methyltransferase CheR
MTRRIPSHETIDRACRLIRHWTGFETNSTTPHRIGVFLTRRARALHLPNPDTYLRFVAGLDPHEREPQRLINLVTNGLTAFWRDEQQLDAIADALRSRPDPERPLQIWCAGSSTGEEAYTLAMISLELERDAYVLGSDVNTESLAIAEAGRYGAWSLRRLGAERRRTFFSEIDDGQWEVRPVVRQRVSFTHHNLLDPTPAPPTGGGWDAILCRNVLIYLTHEARATILRRLADALAPGGYIFLGASEQVLTDVDVPLHSEPIGGSFALRPGAADASTEPRPPEPSPARRESPARSARRAPPRPRRERASTEPDAREPEEPPGLDFPEPGVGLGEAETETLEIQGAEVVLDLLRQGMALQRNGALEDALACFEAAACYDPFIPEAYCLIGGVLEELGSPQRALESYRKALFLAPHHWLAAHRAGEIYESIEDVPRARRAHHQALDGLDRDEDLVDTSFFPEIRGDEDRARRALRRGSRRALERLERILP